MKPIPALLTALALTLPLAGVKAQPTIANQPSSQVALPGSTVAFSVFATGAGPLTYQWQFKETNLPASLIATIAGGGLGDGGAATNAIVYRPFAVALDRVGNLFIVDNGNNRIRKVDAQGLITTVAGSTAGFAGDGGSATQAKFSSPLDLALDPAGNLFVADYNNHRIRQVGPFASLPTLTLNNVTTNHAGDYRVIVTGASGSITSIVATLTVVLERPALTLARNGTNLLLSFPTQTGASYQLESATNLPPATWFAEGAPFLGIGGCCPPTFRLARKQ